MALNIDIALIERNNGHENPSPEEIYKARVSANLSKKESALIVYCATRTWQQWESGDRKMPYGLWELFNIKIKGNAIYGKKM